MKGRFVTFEGGEGAGKTTQLARLAERLKTRGIAVVTTREPGGTPTAEAVRTFLLKGRGKELGRDAEAIIFAAARADHVRNLIAPALAAGKWVLCDRFIDSTRAYQGAAGVDTRIITALERVAVGTTRPDLTLVFDIPAEIGMQRAAARSGKGGPGLDRFERDTLEEHEKRRAAFLEIARHEPGRCVVIDATRPEDEIEGQVWETVEKRLLLEHV